jgi:hypothetical protein
VRRNVGAQLARKPVRDFAAQEISTDGCLVENSRHGGEIKFSAIAAVNLIHLGRSTIRIQQRSIPAHMTQDGSGRDTFDDARIERIAISMEGYFEPIDLEELIAACTIPKRCRELIAEIVRGKDSQSRTGQADRRRKADCFDAPVGLDIDIASHITDLELWQLCRGCWPVCDWIDALRFIQLAQRQRLFLCAEQTSALHLEPAIVIRILETIGNSKARSRDLTPSALSRFYVKRQCSRWWTTRRSQQCQH